MAKCCARRHCESPGSWVVWKEVCRTVVFDVMVFVLANELGDVVAIDFTRLKKCTKPYRKRRSELKADMMVIKMREDMKQHKLDFSALTLLCQLPYRSLEEFKMACAYTTAQNVDRLEIAT